MNLPYSDPNKLIRRETRLLIVDYDVCRYHSFDLFRYMLLDKATFMKVKPEFIPMLKLKKPLDQLDFYRSSLTAGISPLDNFNGMEGQESSALCQELTKMFNDPKSVSTPTEIGLHFHNALVSKGIKTWVMKWSGDNSDIPLYNTTDGKDMNLQIIESENLLSITEIEKIITSNSINAIMVSSASQAVLLALQLTTHGYTAPMTVLIGNYGYNYEELIYHDTPIRGMLFPQEMDLLSQKYQYEFGVFDPYSGLTERHKLIDSEGDING